ncbi:hypothetical protein [Amycolatopsis sp. CA-230715]|uniref:hypothetical protein n=1 Tax=Amycolatopsis sp. CA-230715 TaxID=2745196 RepID=UPI001C02221D|nr:hypothetical protein [Amycolatopsis sp. CA-230715]
MNYRTGPGTRYPSLGHVNHGQGIWITGGTWGNNPVDGLWWDAGNLWGGANNVWIRRDFLNC